MVKIFSPVSTSFGTLPAGTVLTGGIGGGGGTVESESLRGISLELLFTLELSPAGASGCDPWGAPGRALGDGGGGGGGAEGGGGGAWRRVRPGYYCQGFVEQPTSLPAARLAPILVPC